MARNHPTLTRLIHRALRDALARARRAKLRLSPPRWMLAARREDARSDFPQAEWITHRTLDDFIGTFHTAGRRVAVICGRGSFLYQPTTLPAHWAEVLPPAGVAVAAERDRINLWLQLRSVIDPILGLPRIDLNVAEGYDQQSIGFAEGSNETAGRTRLWHLAQLSLGEPPGIPNMPSFSDLGFGLDSAQLEQLRQRRNALAPHERSIAEKFGVYAARLTDEWAEFGGVEQRALSEMRYRCAAHFAIHEDRDLVAEVAQEVIDLNEEELATVLARAFEPLVTEVRALRDGLAAQELSGEVLEVSGEVAETETREAVPRTGRAGGTPALPAMEDQAALAQRALVASRRAVAFGVLPREVAQERAARCLAGGEVAVAAFEEIVQEQSQARAGNLTREVRVSGGGELRLPVDPSRYRSLRHRAEVDPQLLEVSAVVQHRLRAQNPSAPGLDLDQFRRQCQQELEQRTFHP